jgi:DtxR family Mn-dependent transcriptional regulator
LGLTTAAEDYLKIIWTAREWEPAEPVTTKMIAGRLGVSPSTASEAIRRLADRGLLAHAPYGSIELTEQGERLALAMVRRHRLLETFLVEALGYTWDEAHDDAEVLEHAASERLVERIDRALARPVRDPHGDPIPLADGTVVRPQAVPLASLEEGRVGVVARISDADPRVLRYFASVGIDLDAELRVVERRDFAGVVVLSASADAGTIELGDVASQAIWVMPA